MYSVCTLNRAESDQVIDAFLAENPVWSGISRRTTLPSIDGNRWLSISLSSPGDEIARPALSTPLP